MQIIHDQIDTLITNVHSDEIITTSTPKRGKYLPRDTAPKQFFLTQRDINMAMVQKYVTRVNL